MMVAMVSGGSWTIVGSMLAVFLDVKIPDAYRASLTGGSGPLLASLGANVRDPFVIVSDPLPRRPA